METKKKKDVFTFTNNKDIYIDYPMKLKVEKIKTNIILVIDKSYSIVLSIRNHAEKSKFKNWKIFASEGLESGVNDVLTYLKGTKIDNLVLKSHGIFGGGAIKFARYTMDKENIN